MKPIDLVVVGSIGIDTITTPLERRENQLGGSVSYACAAASFCAQTGMVGVVGDDFPDAFRARYQHFGIHLDGLQERVGSTFRWSGEYEADFINRRTLETHLGVFADFAPELPAAFRRAGHVLLGNIDPGLQLRVMAQMDSPRFVVADTMDLWIRTQPELLRRVIAGVDMLTLNDSEARLLTGRHALLDCARDVLAMGPRFVVIKKGEHGAMLFERDAVYLVPAFPVETLRDPTGAGDAFAGGFMGRLCQFAQTDRNALRSALVYGSVTASFSVESFSLDRLESLDSNTIDERLRQLQDMTQWTP